MSFGIKGTTPGNYAVVTPDGYECGDPTKSKIRTFPVLSGTSILRNGLVQWSGGKAVPADASTKPSELIGVAQRSLTGTATGDNSICEVDISIKDGVPFRVVASDGAVAATDEGAGATCGAAANKVLMSGKTVDTGVFIINRVYDTTNKIVEVVINEGYNA